MRIVPITAARLASLLLLNACASSSNFLMSAPLMGFEAGSSVVCAAHNLDPNVAQSVVFHIRPLVGSPCVSPDPSEVAATIAPGGIASSELAAPSNNVVCLIERSATSDQKAFTKRLAASFSVVSAGGAAWAVVPLRTYSEHDPCKP